jgi:uncharacterized protein YkwD
MARRRRGPLPILLTVALAFGAGAAVARAASAATLADLRQRALELVNEARAAQNREALVLAPHTNEAAQAHAADMSERHYYAHRSPEGDTVADRYVVAGGSKWRLTAENIARCAGCPQPPERSTVERLHEGWMQSPEHRHNILRRGLQQFGFGIAATSQGTIYAVQTFAGPGTPRGLQTGEEIERLPPEQQLEHAVTQINRARREADRVPLEASSALADVAQSALPDRRLDNFQLDRQTNILRRLPARERRHWSAVAMLAATCGGCGTVPTQADVRHFAQQWLDDPNYRARLLDAGFTHVGFAVAADGDGKKIALALLGTRR